MSKVQPWLGRRVLIVDDSESIRAELKGLYEQAGMTVSGVAINGLDAIEKARVIKPDLISLDIIMPEMNGIEAHTKLKVEMPDMKTLFISSLGGTQAFIDAVKGTVAPHLFLAKPASLAALEGRLARIFEEPRAKEVVTTMEAISPNS